jgi:hypothetical protein
MTFSTLMVHLELEHSNDARLRIAGDLAEQFDAKLIGIAACDPQPAYYADGAFAQGVIERERAEIRQRMAETEARFRSAMHQRARDIEWRFAMAQPADYVAGEARAADLVITGVNRDGLLLDPLRCLDPSDLVMHAGRPIFVVPPEAEYLIRDYASGVRRLHPQSPDAFPALLVSYALMGAEGRKPSPVLYGETRYLLLGLRFPGFLYEQIGCTDDPAGS